MSREIDCPVCENTGVLLDGDICGHCKGMKNEIQS